MSAYKHPAPPAADAVTMVPLLLLYAFREVVASALAVPTTSVALSF